jgi:hypothetical protein
MQDEKKPEETAGTNTPVEEPQKRGEQEEGLGSLLSRKLSRAGDAIGRAVGDAVEDTIKAGRRLHQDVQAQGGYGAVVKKAGEGLVNTVREAYGGAHDSIRDNFFTEGEFDPDKAKKVLSDSGEAVRRYGTKATDALTRLAEQGADLAKRGFHEIVPTDEELATKYKGIGTECKGPLLRMHYDNCLEFLGWAEKTIPSGTKYRRQVLEDIKAVAAANPGELRDAYLEKAKLADEDSTVSLKKAEFVNRFLAGDWTEQH